MSGRQQRVMVQPINLIFKNLQQAQDFLSSGSTTELTCLDTANKNFRVVI